MPKSQLHLPNLQSYRHFNELHWAVTSTKSFVAAVVSRITKSRIIANRSIGFNENANWSLCIIICEFSAGISENSNFYFESSLEPPRHGGELIVTPFVFFHSSGVKV